MRLTQKQLIVKYVEEFGSIVPAKMYGTLYHGQILGSELSRRARELRAEGKLRSEGVGKFERFYIVKPKTVVWHYKNDGTAIKVEIDEATEILKEIINQPEQERLI